jgi:hypothetical protein
VGRHRSDPSGLWIGSKPALESAGLPSRRIYAMRNLFATWALDAGLSIFDIRASRRERRRPRGQSSMPRMRDLFDHEVTAETGGGAE